MKKTVFLLLLLLPLCSLIAQPFPFTLNVVPVDVERVHTGWQIGNDNSAEGVQVGDLSYINVVIVGDDNAYSLWLQQGDGGNFAEVEQITNNSDFYLHQKNEDGNLDNYNSASIDQNGLGGHSATVVQEFINAEGDAGTQEAWLLQNNENNSSVQMQKGKYNTVKAVQNGTNNRVIQNQGMLPPWLAQGAAYNSDARVWQFSTADNNTSRQLQVGSQNDATIWQGYDDSYALQLQVSDADVDLLADPVNKAIINQWFGFADHTGNRAYQVQYYKAEVGGQNYAIVSQLGSNDNVSVQVQLGGGNDSRVWQNGEDNNMKSLQTKGMTLSSVDMPFAVPIPFLWTPF